MSDDMQELIARLEQAKGSVQAPHLKRIIDAAWRAKWISDATWHRAEEYLNVGAYLDAAALLVPDGWIWWVNSRNYARLWIVEDDRVAAVAQSQECATPALALAAAALRAHNWSYE